VIKIALELAKSPDEERKERALRLVKFLLICGEENLTKDSADLMGIVREGVKEKKKRKDFTAGVECCALIGLFFSPSAYLPFLIQKERKIFHFDALPLTTAFAPSDGYYINPGFSINPEI
jgi:hypothetical protein